MSVLSDIREGFKTVVEAISGLRVYAYEPDGALEHPCLVLEPTEDLPYEMGAGDSNHLQFDLMATLYLHSQDSDEGWKEIDKYRSPTGTESIRAKVQGDRTLNASCDYAEASWSGEARRDRDSNDRRWEYSCQFRINVIKRIP